MILAIANQKGGSGKTQTAAALAQAAALSGRKVLAIDLDPQANLTFSLAADANRPGSYALLTSQDRAAALLQQINGIAIIGATWNLQTITTSRGSARRLQKALEPVKEKFDLVIIDTPPTAGELQYNALQAATDILIPLTADIYGLQGLYQLIDTVEQIKQSNPALKYRGIVFTRHNPRAKITQAMQENIINAAAAFNIPYLGYIRQGIAAQEAAALQQSLFDYAPKSKPAQDYLQLYKKLEA